MFAVIYQFSVKTGKEQQFCDAWKKLTELIMNYEDSLGSRLHHESDQTYIAYAQWKSREQWENAGAKLPESAVKFRELMKDACKEIKTIHELEVIADLLI